AVTGCQFHQVESCNRPPRYDRLVVELQDLCQAVPGLFWRERDLFQQRTGLRERVGNECALIERSVVIAEGQEGRGGLSSIPRLAGPRHGANDRRGVEPPG